MGRENTAKSMPSHAFTQFELTKNVLNNLSQFKLKPTAKLVLLYLCDCYNPKHGEMFPKQSTIAMKLGISEVSVIRAIQELHKEGLLISERKYTNRYKFTSRIVQECPENLIDNNHQKDSSENIKKIAPCIEQKKETKKEQTNKELGGNVYFSDFTHSQRVKKDYLLQFYTPQELEILREYVRKKGNITNIDGYVNRIRLNGNDKQILKDIRKKTFVVQRAKNNIIETKQLIEQSEQLKTTAVLPCNSPAFLELGRKLGLK
ncbi:MAG: helix-turn-helix domain-containing protein [Muribaculaceae bacterium]|nr:helix-turn-helix domain-containing protein [Muribaculaceae bacterium]